MGRNGEGMGCDGFCGCEFGMVRDSGFSWCKRKGRGLRWVLMGRNGEGVDCDWFCGEERRVRGVRWVLWGENGWDVRREGF